VGLAIVASILTAPAARPLEPATAAPPAPVPE
jgi:hypothetical protein